MKRGIWIGAAVLVALAAAPALWLALDGGGDRRAAALVEPAAGGGELGILTLKTAQTGTVTVPVQSFSLGITTPYDAATGLASGQPRFEPLQVFRPVNSSSPLLLKIIATNETISSAEFEVRLTNPSTGEVGTAMTYTFGGAALSRWSDNASATRLGRQQLNDAKRGLLALRYQTVTVKTGTFEPAVGQTVGQMTISSLGETPIPITDFAADVVVSVDAATGLAGKRQHEPVLVRHFLGEKSITLLENAKSGTGLGTVTVKLARPTEAGTELYATYVFGNATIASVEDAGVGDQGAPSPTQELKLAYKSLTVTIEKKSGQDSFGGKP